MKRLTILMVGLVMTLSQASAQTKTSVPTKVKTAFTQKFSKAKKVKWDKENKTEWEAEFKMNGENYSANFTLDGTWKETEYRIKKSKIPSVVKKTLDNDFSDYDIKVAELSETTEGKVYEFALEKGESNLEVCILPTGIVSKKEIQTENEEDNN